MKMLAGSVGRVEGVEDTKIKQQQYKGKDERGEVNMTIFQE